MSTKLQFFLFYKLSTRLKDEEQKALSTFTFSISLLVLPNFSWRRLNPMNDERRRDQIRLGCVWIHPQSLFEADRGVFTSRARPC